MFINALFKAISFCERLSEKFIGFLLPCDVVIVVKDVIYTLRKIIVLIRIYNVNNLSTYKNDTVY